MKHFREEMYVRCSNCEQSIWKCEIDGEPCPVVVRVIVGQLPNTGARVDLTEKLKPEALREIAALPSPRANLCVRCANDLFA